jgi:hypothetical protein
MGKSCLVSYFTVLRIRIRDPVPFDPWIRDPGWVESQHPDPGSGMNNPDHIFQSLETIFFVFLGLKYLNTLMRIRDPGWEKVGSATLLFYIFFSEGAVDQSEPSVAAECEEESGRHLFLPGSQPSHR